MGETDVKLRLGEERRKRGWSQQDLARRVGIWAQTVSALERGYLHPQPTAKVIQKLARALGVAAEDLLRPVDDVVDHDE